MDKKKNLFNNMEEIWTCTFCRKEFISDKFFQIHLNRCKWRKDSIRNFELELGVTVEDDISIHGCRFCGQGWINREEHFKMCQKRQEYKTKLESLHCVK